MIRCLRRLTWGEKAKWVKGLVIKENEVKHDKGSIKFINPTSGEVVFGKFITPERLLEIIPGKLIMPGDICIEWETGEASTYSQDWIDRLCEQVSN